MLKELREKLKWLDPFTYVDKYVMPKINPNNSEWVSLVVYIVFAFVFAFIIFNVLGFILGTGSPMVIVVSGSMEPVLYRGDVVILSGVHPGEIKSQEVTLDLSLVDSLPLSEYATTLCTKNSETTTVPCSSLPNTLHPNYNTTSIRFVNGETVPVNTLGDIVVYNSFSGNGSIQIIHRVVAKIIARDGVYLLTKGDNVLGNVKIDQELGIARSAVKADSIEGRALFWIPKIGCLKLWPLDNLPTLLFSGELPRDFSGFC